MEMLIILIAMMFFSLLGFYLLARSNSEVFPKIETEEELETITRNRQVGGA